MAHMNDNDHAQREQNPWRARNLERIAEARRVLQAARTGTLSGNPDAEGGSAPGDPPATDGTPDATPEQRDHDTDKEQEP